MSQAVQRASWTNRSGTFGTATATSAMRCVLRRDRGARRGILEQHGDRALLVGDHDPAVVALVQAERADEALGVERPHADAGLQHRDGQRVVDEVAREQAAVPQAPQHHRLDRACGRRPGRGRRGGRTRGSSAGPRGCAARSRRRRGSGPPSPPAAGAAPAASAPASPRRRSTRATARDARRRARERPGPTARSARRSLQLLHRRHQRLLALDPEQRARDLAARGPRA